MSSPHTGIDCYISIKEVKIEIQIERNYSLILKNWLFKALVIRLKSSILNVFLSVHQGSHTGNLFSASLESGQGPVSATLRARDTSNLLCFQLYLPSQVANPLQLWTSSSNKVETLLCQEQRSHPMVRCGDYQGFQLLQRISPQYPGQFVVSERFLDAWHFVPIVWLILYREPLLVFCSAGCLSACGW